MTEDKKKQMQKTSFGFAQVQNISAHLSKDGN
jgi:hypothetical protein